MGSKAAKQLVFISSFAACIYLPFFVVVCLSQLKTSTTPEIFLNRIALCLIALFFPIVGGWYAFRVIGGLSFSFFTVAVLFFVVGVTKSQLFLWLILAYALLQIMLYAMDQFYSVRISLVHADREKAQIEKNDRSSLYKTKGEAISILFEKYSTYYNMRKLAEELASTLAVPSIGKITVLRSLDFILRGDFSLMTLFEKDTNKLPVIAVHEIETFKASQSKSRLHEPDHFDQWVIKNRRQLIVMDTRQDFRFDSSLSQSLLTRSLIAAPLIQEGKVMGTLRINSIQVNTFTHDDLRLLDTIAVLAASALSNALLYAQTEELAIKDSLTSLYVRRYFFDRLREEHRRSLMTKRPLSILMCDLDHFKQCNDRYGHGVGDLMLVEFAKILSAFSESALVGRYGGEEFVVLLPETDKKEAYRQAENLRLLVEKTPLMVRREQIQMTVSIGVANLPEDTLSVDDLIQLADKGLYEAKRAGRNRVC